MVPARLIPTQLVPPSERPPIPLHRPRSVRFRSIEVLGSLLRLLLGNILLAVGGRRTRARRHARVVNGLERLGMLWIRVAQTLVTRGAQVATPFGRSILDLSDHGKARPFADIRPIIETDLGRPLEDLFLAFEEQPFAATTISQIHRAVLPSKGLQVAVKVQNPEAEALFSKDLRLFRFLVKWLRFFRMERGMRWEDLYHELKEMMAHELNYYYEANMLERLSEQLKGQYLYVPKVFRKISGHRVLVMEFIQGALLSDYQEMMHKDPERLARWLQENSIHPEKIAPRLFAAVYRQIFEDNLFHGDMSSKNIILLRDGHLAVIDCRNAGSLEGESLMKQKLFMRAFAEREHATAAEIYFLLANRLPRVNLEAVKDLLVRVWRTWEFRTHVEDLPYEEKSLSWMMAKMNTIINQHGFAAQWSFSKMSVALLHLDQVLATLAPRWDYHKHLRLYFQREGERETYRKVRNLPKRAVASLLALHEMPKRMGEYTLFQESLVRRQGQVVQGSASKVDAIIASLFAFLAFAIFLALVLLISATLPHHGLADISPWLGPQLTGWLTRLPPGLFSYWFLAIGGTVMLFLILRLQHRRFVQGEFGKSGTKQTISL